jgi:hypothetical protein
VPLPPVRSVIQVIMGRKIHSVLCLVVCVLCHHQTAAIEELALIETLSYDDNNNNNNIKGDPSKDGTQIYAVDWTTNGEHELLAAAAGGSTIAFWQQILNTTANSTTIYEWKLKDVMRIQRTSSVVAARVLAFSPGGGLLASGSFCFIVVASVDVVV